MNPTVSVEVLVLVDVQVLREPPQQGGLPGVRVARQRHEVEPGLAALLAPVFLVLLDALQVLADARDALLDVLLA